MVNISELAQKIDERITALRLSPVRGLKPVSDEVQLLNIEDIELDPTNPGSMTTSRRYERRAESMLDSYDILDGVVYPVIVCEKTGEKGKYIHIDGAGRITMLKGKGIKKVKAIVYPSMNLEDRICFRQTLNAAQEPFDAVSIIHDLRILADERGISLNDRGQLKALVRDLPARVQARERDLLLLAHWDPNVIKRMGEPSDVDQDVIGLDQLRGLTRLLLAIAKQHPEVEAKVGGKHQVSVALANLFEKRRFADGMRSQEGIRAAIKAIRQLPPNSETVLEFLKNSVELSELEDAGDAAERSEASDSTNLVKACKQLAGILVGIDADDLTEQQKSALERTQRVLESVLV